MRLEGDAVRLRLYLGEKERADHRPLYEDVLLKAREAHLAGATVMRGVAGFGHSSVLHSAKILRLSDDLPVMIEIIDAQEKIEAFLPLLEPLSRFGLITAEPVQTLRDA